MLKLFCNRKRIGSFSIICGILILLSVLISKTINVPLNIDKKLFVILMTVFGLYMIIAGGGYLLSLKWAKKNLLFIADSLIIYTAVTAIYSLYKMFIMSIGDTIKNIILIVLPIIIYFLIFVSFRKAIRKN